MSDGETQDQPAAEAGEETKTKARGKKEKQANDAVLAQQAEEKQAEEEAHEADPDQPEGQEPPDADQLRGEIAETREDLGDTVEALAAKTDVKAQAKAKVDEQKAQLKDKQDQAQQKVDETVAQAKENPTPYAAVAGGVVAFLLLVLLLKRRSS
jgi:ElaB/YqjD/DUF883 family membrane-anchored ribosome-binding protein